ncbi:hypothetical protein JRO89_XS09G0231200 [Xanthoceras sorbifolium]|uniref:Cytochrome P450 n=1 Tax=Xanthoceras sorbifolium TaxID=99658 RepID=A0ABQ8HMV6_9ROSI|nr:hypothetical protein JRO89_XS09G0231200 [Xanthoceras sorbifolium]
MVSNPILILLSRRLRRRKLNLPPGPKLWPIIGNLNLIGPLPHRSIRALSQKYGPIMQLKFGSFPVVVGSSAEIAKSILKTNDVTFASRPKTYAGKYTTYNYSNITWSPYGPYWRQARRMCLMELFSPKRLKSYEYIRVEETQLLLKTLYKSSSSGKPVLLKVYLSDVSLNVISRMVLGKKYTDDDRDDQVVSAQEFKEMLDELFLLNGVFDIGDSIPWLGFLDLQGHIKRMKVVAKKFDRFLEHILIEHNERRTSGVENYQTKDMVDVLLELADDPTLDVKLERHGDLLAAGTESSATTLEWAISEVLKNPKIFHEATEELDRVIGKERWVEEKDMDNLPYINAIVKETMRLHPVAPMLVPRIAREDCEIAGYDIPKNTRVIVNAWAIATDPNLWKNPNERMCPGYSLGLKVIQSNLANLLHGFAWKLPENMRVEDLNMEEIFGLSTPRKYPLEAVVEPRLPAHLYDM